MKEGPHSGFFANTDSSPPNHLEMMLNEAEWSDKQIEHAREIAKRVQPKLLVITKIEEGVDGRIAAEFPELSADEVSKLSFKFIIIARELSSDHPPYLAQRISPELFERLAGLFEVDQN